MIIKQENDIEYCDCLDWNEEFKERQLSTMALFNKKLHTTGVTLKERRAYYITTEDRTPEEIELGNRLQVAA